MRNTMRNMIKHTCTRDDRGLCEVCEILKRDEGLMLRGWAASIVEETRIKMVKGIMMEELVNV